MKNLIVSCPSLGDGTSFYRVTGPLSELRKTKDFHIVPMEDGAKWSWAIASLGDAFLMQRPWRDVDIEIAKLIKEQGKPLWIDWDDDLTTIPRDNPCFDQFKGCESNIYTLASMADVVTVSTEYLRQKFVQHNKNTLRLPNAYNFNMNVGERPPREKRVIWRGSDTHRRDLDHYRSEITSLVLDPELKDYAWFFMGYTPYWLFDSIRQDKKVFSFPQVDPIKYHKLLQVLAPTLAFVPLFPCDFNLAKSNCAWLEFTGAGAITVAPDWEEWRRPGVQTYGSRDSFYEVMRKNLLEPSELLARQSLDDVDLRFNLHDTNLVREQILKEFGVL